MTTYPAPSLLLFRQSAHLTQRQVAVMLQVTLATVKQYETGQLTLNASLLAQLVKTAKGSNVTPQGTIIPPPSNQIVPPPSPINPIPKF